MDKQRETRDGEGTERKDGPLHKKRAGKDRSDRSIVPPRSNCGPDAGGDRFAIVPGSFHALIRAPVGVLQGLSWAAVSGEGTWRQRAGFCETNPVLQNRSHVQPLAPQQPLA